MEQVIISVQGGVASATHIPGGVTVVIRDYDDGEHCDCEDPADCELGGVDEDSFHYHESEKSAS